MQNAACSLPLFGVSLSPIDVSSFCILFPTLKAHLVTSPGRLKPEVSTNSFVFILLLTVVNSSCLSRNRYLYWLKNICLKLISSSWSSGSSFSHIGDSEWEQVVWWVFGARSGWWILLSEKLVDMVDLCSWAGQEKIKSRFSAGSSYMLS